VPTSIPALATPYAVARELDWRSANVSDDKSFSLKKLVTAFRSQEHKKPAMPKVLHVRQTLPLPSASRPLRDCDAVASDELRIDSGQILSFRDFAGDIEPVAMRNVSHGKLLNEPGN
jgi:hypothetical protein